MKATANQINVKISPSENIGSRLLLIESSKVNGLFEVYGRVKNPAENKAKRYTERGSYFVDSFDDLKIELHVSNHSDKFPACRIHRNEYKFSATVEKRLQDGEWVDNEYQRFDRPVEYFSTYTSSHNGLTDAASSTISAILSEHVGHLLNDDEFCREVRQKYFDSEVKRRNEEIKELQGHIDTLKSQQKQIGFIKKEIDPYRKK